MDGSFGAGFGFQPGASGRDEAARASFELGPDHRGGPGLPEREWGLSAGQVTVAVLAIVALCEVFGAFL